MAQAPPILIYQPGGGVSFPIGSNPPVYSQTGVTALVEGQEYLDVVFGSIQTDDEWVLVDCEVVNETDVDPLNLWPGIITERTDAGFRIYFNGLPDSGNYYLHWAVSGINIEASPASTYYLTGPSSVTGDEAAVYTAALPPSTFVDAAVTVTPSEGGLEIGTFSPETVVLTTDSPSQTFTFTPATYGDTTITVNNDRNFTDPVDLALSVVPPTYTLEGPSSGESGVASTDFTVELSGATLGTVTVTPASTGGGSFTPTDVALTTLAPSDTFTYTPSSAGTKTISVTNDSGLDDPDSLSYEVTVPVLTFNDTFTEAILTDITSHTSDTGHTWSALLTSVAEDFKVSGGTGHLYEASFVGVAPEIVSNYTPASADTEATITVVKGSVTGLPEVGIWLRSTPDATNPRGYVGRFVEGTGYQFYRLDAGVTFVQLGSNVAGTMADSDTLRFTISGTGATVTLTLYKNGASVATVNDTAGGRIVTTGRIGIHLHDPSGATGNYRVTEISSP